MRYKLQRAVIALAIALASLFTGCTALGMVSLRPLFKMKRLEAKALKK
jgi:hypothetical protein